MPPFFVLSSCDHHSLQSSDPYLSKTQAETSILALNNTILYYYNDSTSCPYNLTECPYKNYIQRDTVKFTFFSSFKFRCNGLASLSNLGNCANTQRVSVNVSVTLMDVSMSNRTI